MTEKEANQVWRKHFKKRFAIIPPGRDAEVVELRQSLIKDAWDYQTKDGKQFSMHALGKLMGYRDHTTILHHLRRMELI